MIKTITEIFEEIQPPNRSMSLARKHWALGNVRFNGEQITALHQEVEVEPGSAFQVDKALWKWNGSWIRHRSVEKGAEYRLRLNDMMDQDKSILLRITRANDMVMVGADGYGEPTAQDGFGFPVVMECFERKWRLLVWSDINKEEPTHIISLEGARESAREAESTH